MAQETADTAPPRGTESAVAEATAFGGSSAIRQAFDSAGLAAWMHANVPGFAGGLQVEQFNGGQSNPTYKLTDAAGTRYVMRRKPPGTLLASAHAVDREYRVMTALAGTGVPVPRTHGLCTDDRVIGTMFYVMAYVPGRVIWDINTEAWSNADRRAVFDAALGAIAKLHTVDYQKVGLGDYGKPGNYFARQFKRWSGQYEYTKSALANPALEALIQWIPAHTPSDDRTTIVHGDPNISNMMFHGEKPEVLALLDWELSTLGHPLVDVAYLFHGYYSAPFEGPPTLPRLGLPTVDQVIDQYCAATNIPRISAQDWRFYIVFNMFRLSAILQGIAKRAQDGTASNPQAVLMGGRAVALAASAMELASGGGGPGPSISTAAPPAAGQ